jgi:hypothetical protein
MQDQDFAMLESNLIQGLIKGGGIFFRKRWFRCF